MRISPFNLLCITGFFAIFSSTVSKSPVLPLFAAHLGAGPSDVGLIASVSAFTGVVFSIPAGMFSDRFGRKKMLLYSSFIFFSAPLFYLFISDLRQLAAVRFYHGFATAVFVPVSMASVSELFHAERGEKMGLFSTSTLLGRFMAPLAGGSVIGAFAFDPALGYRVVYIVCGLAGAAAFAIAYFLPVSETAGHEGGSWRETFGAFRVLISSRNVLVTCFVEAAILFSYGTFETFLPLYSLGLGISPQKIGLLLGAQVITLALSKPLMGRFSDRHGRRPQIFFGALMGAFCVGGISVAGGFIAMLVLSIAFGLGLSTVTSATSAYIADLSEGKARGSAMGLLGSIMDVGHTAGPIVSGIVAAQFGYPKAFVSASCVLVFFAVLFTAFTGAGREN